MPLPNPTEPQNGEIIDADFLRGRFDYLDNRIDTLPAPGAPTIADVLATGNSAGHQNLFDLEQLQLDSGGGRIAANVQAGAVMEFSAPGGSPLLQIRVDPTAAEPQRIVCDGGELVIRSTVAIRLKGRVIMPDLPTADPHNAGELWNEAGYLRVSAG